MVVYADVLIVLNLFINFFILKLTAALCRDRCRTLRLLLGALVGALFSLYIFLPTSGILVETAFRLAMSGVIILTCFGFDSFKSFVRRTAVFFAASFLYAGAMMGVWALCGTDRLAINNGIVYVDISPLVLILATVASYAGISLIRWMAKKHAYEGKRCRLAITVGEKTVVITALVDTGHSLTDALTDKQVLIVEQRVAKQLLHTVPTPELVLAGGKMPNGFRMIPYSAIGGHGLLPAFEADRVELERADGKRQILSQLLIAISAEPLGEDYRAIISPTTVKGEF